MTGKILAFKGFDEKKIFSGKGIQALDDAANKLLRKFEKGEISIKE